MPSVTETIDLLFSFSKLPEGWNFGSGTSSAPIAFGNGLFLVSNAIGLEGIDDIEVFPGTDGEIQVNFYKDAATLEMIFEIDGTIAVTFEEGEKSVQLATAASINKAIKFLEEFEYNKCRSSVSLTSQITTVPNAAVLLALHFDRPATVAGSPSLTRIVAKNVAEASAYTLRGITREQRGHLSSFGKSRTNKSQTLARQLTA